MEETIENLTQWWEYGYICGARQAGITGVVLLTIFFLIKTHLLKQKYSIMKSYISIRITIITSHNLKVSM